MTEYIQYMFLFVVGIVFISFVNACVHKCSLNLAVRALSELSKLFFLLGSLPSGAYNFPKLCTQVQVSNQLSLDANCPDGGATMIC